MPVPFSTRMQVAGKALVGLFSQRQTVGAIEQLLRGIIPPGKGDPPVKNTRELLALYSEMPWLRAATERIARSYAAVTWHVMAASSVPSEERAWRHGVDHAIKDMGCQRGNQRDRAKALKRRKDAGELREIESGPLVETLHGANAYFTGMARRKLESIYLDTVGDSYLMKQRGPMGVPVALWPLPPHWIIGTPSPSAPSFQVSFRGWTGAIPSTEILWLSDPNPVNPYARGAGMAMALSDELDTDELAAKYLRRFFYNNAQPPVVIHGKGMNERNTKELETSWTEKTRGFWNAYKPFFMSNEITVTELGQSFKDMQMSDLRGRQRDTILQVYGLPPEIFGIVENSNRATIDAADLIMARYVVEPRLELVRETLQERLVPEYDDRLILTYDSPVQEDREFALKVATARPEVPSVDEWRCMMGLEELGDREGELHIVNPQQFTVRSLEELMGAPEPVTPPAGGDNEDPAEDPMPEEPMEEPAA